MKVIGHRQLDTCRTAASCGLTWHTVICIVIVMYTMSVDVMTLISSNCLK